MSYVVPSFARVSQEHIPHPTVRATPNDPQFVFQQRNAHGQAMCASPGQHSQRQCLVNAGTVGPSTPSFGATSQFSWRGVSNVMPGATPSSAAPFGIPVEVVNTSGRSASGCASAVTGTPPAIQVPVAVEAVQSQRTSASQAKSIRVPVSIQKLSDSQPSSKAGPASISVPVSTTSLSQASFPCKSATTTTCRGGSMVTVPVSTLNLAEVHPLPSQSAPPQALHTDSAVRDGDARSVFPVLERQVDAISPYEASLSVPAYVVGGGVPESMPRGVGFQAAHNPATVPFQSCAHTLQTVNGGEHQPRQDKKASLAAWGQLPQNCQQDMIDPSNSASVPSAAAASICRSVFHGMPSHLQESTACSNGAMNVSVPSREPHHEMAYMVKSSEVAREVHRSNYIHETIGYSNSASTPCGAFDVSVPMGEPQDSKACMATPGEFASNARRDYISQNNLQDAIATQNALAPSSSAPVPYGVMDLTVPLGEPLDSKTFMATQQEFASNVGRAGLQDYDSQGLLHDTLATQDAFLPSNSASIPFGVMDVPVLPEELQDSMACMPKADQASRDIRRSVLQDHGSVRGYVQTLESRASRDS